MKKTIVLLLFIISLLSNGQYKSLLWEISGNGLESPSYLYGTIHMIPKKDFFLTKETKEHFKECDKLVMEVDMFNMSLKQQIDVARQAMFNGGESLQMAMGDSAYFAFITYLTDSLGIKERKTNKYNRFKPFFISGLILKDYLGRIKAYEQVFSKMAKRKKMTVAGLETLDFQMNLIGNLPIDDQIEMFVDVEGINEYFDLLNYYKEQDLSGLMELSEEAYEDPKYDAFMDELLLKRNLNWIPIIKDFIEKEQCFIAVGAMHLPGEDGVIELLRKEGYTVTSVK